MNFIAAIALLSLLVIMLIGLGFLVGWLADVMWRAWMRFALWAETRRGKQ